MGEFDLPRIAHELTQKIVYNKNVGTYYKRDQKPIPVPNPTHSGNYGLIEKATQLVHGFKVDRNLELFDQVVDMCYERQRKGISAGFMNSEQESRVYCSEHYISMLTAYIIGASSSVLNWLLYFHALAEMSSTPEGRVLWVGQRSGMPDRHKPQWIDAFLDVARRKPIDRWRKSGGWGWPDMWRILAKRATVIANIHDMVPRGREAFQMLQQIGFTLRTNRFWLVRKANNEVAASWTTHSVNSNTPAMLGAVQLLNGDLLWAPHKGGEKRERQKGDKSTCTLVVNGESLSLRYEATVVRPSPWIIPIDANGLHQFTFYKLGLDGTSFAAPLEEVNTAFHQSMP